MPHSFYNEETRNLVDIKLNFKLTAIAVVAFRLAFIVLRRTGKTEVQSTNYQNQVKQFVHCVI